MNAIAPIQCRLPVTRSVATWLSIRDYADPAASEPVEIMIYGQIGADFFGEEGINAQMFSELLAPIPKTRDIVVRIHSGGGNVWDGLAIYHQLQARKERVVTIVDGLAASIASIIALAGHEARMPKNALMMIHDPSGLVIGNSEDMRKMATDLDKHADVLAGIYADKGGEPDHKLRRQMWRRQMRDETWFTGVEAKAAGLVDTVTDAVDLKAHRVSEKIIRLVTNQELADGWKLCASASIDISGFRRVPEALQQIPAIVGTTQNTMNKKLIIALLAQHGVTVAEDAADQVFLDALNKLVEAKKVTEQQRDDLAPPTTPRATATLAAAPPTSAAAAPPTDDSRIVNLERQLKGERDRRITGELDQLIAENPAIDRAEWLPKVIADESLMASLRKLPKPAPGAEPVRASITNLGNPLLAKYDTLSPGETRRDFLRNNYSAMLRVRREFRPQAVNTFDSALVPDFLADGLIVVANNKLAALQAFSRRFSLDALRPGVTVQVKKATASSAAQQNPTNFETGDTTLDNIAVTVTHVNVGMHVTQAEANDGFMLSDLAAIKADTFVNTISDLWTTLIKTASGPADEVIGAAALFDTGVLADIYGFAKNFRSKGLTLDGSYIGRILSHVNPQAFKVAPQGDRGAFGFDNLAEQNRWTDADANTVGIVNGPDSIAVASGLPVENLDRGQFDEVGNITVPQLGLTVVSHVWGSLSSRTRWASLDVMIGFALGDTTQLTILKSA